MQRYTKVLTLGFCVFLASNKISRHVMDASTDNNHNDSFAMALADSDGFFDNISDESWKLLKQRVKERVNHFKSQMHNIHNSPAWYQGKCISLKCKRQVH